MDIKNKEAFESKFKLNAIYERESRIRKNNILEFAETAGIYFNIVTNNAWELWQAAQAQAVPEGFVLVPKEPTEAMYIAGTDKRQSGGNTADVYKAMIEA